MLNPTLRQGSRPSLDECMLRDIFTHARPLGHHEDAESLNLGFGHLYYGLVRALRPAHIVVIGSGYGFSVVCLALAMKDNGFGRLSFVDPSYSGLTHGPFRVVGGTSQWDNPRKVHAHFARFGVEDIVTHYKMTSEEFFAPYSAHGLPAIDLAFVDGNHSYTSVRHDFLAVLRHAKRNSYVLMHDTNIYMRELVRHAGVKRWLRKVSARREAFEVVDFPFSSGVAVVRVINPKVWGDGVD